MVETNKTSKCIGVIYALLSGVSFTLFNIFFKLIKSLSLAEVIFIRNIVQLILILPILIALRVDVRGEKGGRLFLWSGALLQPLASLLELISVKMVPFGDAITIQYCSPVLIMLLGCCLLKEHCGAYKIVIVILFLIGIILITKPPGIGSLLNIIKISANPQNNTKENGRSSSLYGYLAGFGGTLGFSFCTLLNKKISDTTHFSVIIFSNTIFNILASSSAIPLVSSYGISIDWTEIVYASMVGGFGFLGNMLIILSLKRLAAGIMSMVRSSEIVLAYIMAYIMSMVTSWLTSWLTSCRWWGARRSCWRHVIQIICFKESSDAASVVGALAVMLAVVFITQEENILEYMAEYTRTQTVKYVPLDSFEIHEELLNKEGDEIIEQRREWNC